MGPTRRAITALVCLLLVTQSASFGPVNAAATPGSHPAGEVAADPAPRSPATEEPAPLAVQTTFDNFNRTVASGWGVSSSGVGWNTNTSVEGLCPSYSTSVDGQVGKIARINTGSCIPFMAASAGNGPWKQLPAWTFTGRFRAPPTLLPAEGGLLIGIRRSNSLGDRYLSALSAAFASGGGSVGLSCSHCGTGYSSTAPFTWTANAWYQFKWVQVWGDQTRLKVWPSGQAEPATWLVSLNTAVDVSDRLPFSQLEVSFRLSPNETNSTEVDDFAFGEAALLPQRPPPPETEHNPPSPNQELAGDPVSTFTGALHDTVTDVAVPGRGPAIEFQRAYNSNDPRVTALGPGWTHSYNISLVSPGDGTEDVILVGPRGRSDRYTENGGTYEPPIGTHASLAKQPDDTYTVTHKSQVVWIFSPLGRLTQIRDRYGNASTLTYNGSGQITAISDPAGRGSLLLGYTNGKLTSLTDWASPARVIAYEYDASGRLWKMTDREGKTTTYTYDGTTHRLATVTDPRGNVALTTSYDAQGRVATQKDARGLVSGDATTFAYVVNPDGTRETTVTAPPTSFEPSFAPSFAPSLTDAYDPSGWLVQRVTRPSSTETLTQAFTYDGNGNRTSATDARGNRIDFCNDVSYAGTPITGSDGNLTRRIDPAPTVGADRPVTLIAYDAKDNATQIVAPEGVPSGATVTCATDLSAINTAHAVDLAYDASGVALLATTRRFSDPDLGLRTATTKYEYGDAANAGLITRLVPPRGNTGPSPDYTYATNFSYFTTGATAGMLKDVTDALGNRTSFAYDAVGRLTSIVDPLGNATGDVPAEHTTTLSYDREDRLRFRTLPAPMAGGAGLAEETRYDAAGNPTVRIDANGQVTTFAYDQRNSLASVTESALIWTDPASPPSAVIVTNYEHDAGGNVSRVTRAAGDAQYERVTGYAYDGRGMLRRETQYPGWPSTAGALVATAVFDPNGNPLTTTDPLGRMTTFAYDALNRLTGVDYSDPGTPDVAYAYDANGNRTSMTDGTGTTTYAVDEAGRLTSVTSPGPATVGYRYDLDGNRTKLIYSDGTAVTYTWNKGGQLASLVDWASRAVSYTYAPDGLVRTATNPNGSAATYSYDNARRLVDILHGGPSGAVLDRFAYTLDAAGNVSDLANGSLAPQFARPDGFVGSNGTWTGTYASIDEPSASDADFLASPSGPTTSNYYEVSLSDVTEPHALTGITVRYRYAKSGNNSGKTTNLTVELRQGTTVIASQAHTNIPGVTGSGWQAGSFTLTTAQANAITNFADLRLRFRPSSSGGGQSRSAQVSWAQLELASAGDPASLISYTYDRLYRLRSVEDVGGTESYTYDPVGNRLTAGATAFTYDRADRITAAGAISVTVDANGNLTANGADTFAFDQANRLTSATVDSVTETYAYDGDGTRASRQVGSDPAIGYVSDVAGGLPVTIDDGSRKYVYGLGLAYGVSGASIEVYHADHLRSVRSLTDGTGSVVATYRTDAWGVATATMGSSTQPFGFTGESTDATGLSYLRARYYDPELGRFLSRDIWAGGPSAPQTLNRYSYVANNPVRNTDPSGHCGIDLIADVGFSAFSLGQLIFGPEKQRGENLGYFLLDAGGVFIPCGAGLGMISRGARAGIKLSEQALEHVVQRHAISGALTAGKSVFSQGEDIAGLIRAAESLAPVQQPGGNFQRIVDAGRVIGIDRATGQPTSIYTVITNAADGLVTAFPGVP